MPGWCLWKLQDLWSALSEQIRKFLWWLHWKKDQRNISLIVLMVAMTVTLYFPAEHRNEETSEGKWWKGARDEGWKGNDRRRPLTRSHVQWWNRKQKGQHVCEMSASWIQPITQHPPETELLVAFNTWQEDCSLLELWLDSQYNHSYVV